MAHSDIQQQRHPALRMVLLVIGWLSVVLGVIGIFVPVLPTTPFLLLAAACFVRSSRRFYLWLVEHPRLGPWPVLLPRAPALGARLHAHQRGAGEHLYPPPEDPARPLKRTRQPANPELPA
jgi:hypothetical protein